MVAETRRFLGEVVVTRTAVNELTHGAVHHADREPFGLLRLPAPSADYAVTTRPAGRGIGILAQGALLAERPAPALRRDQARRASDGPAACRQRPTARRRCHLWAGAARHLHDAAALRDGPRREPRRARLPPALRSHRFGFEHYDEVGRYRDLDGGLPSTREATCHDDGGAPCSSFDSKSWQGLAARKQRTSAPAMSRT